MTPGPGIEPGTHWWKASALTTTPTLLPAVAMESNCNGVSPAMESNLFHNVRSLHLHIDDVRSDYNIQKAYLNICVETRLCALDRDDVYNIKGFTLYRNDYNRSQTRSSYGSAVYVKDQFHCRAIPHRFNCNGVEITITVADQPNPNLHVIGIYRSSSNVNLANFIDTLNHLYDSKLTTPDVPVALLGNFNVNRLEKNSEQKALTTWKMFDSKKRLYIANKTY